MSTLAVNAVQNLSGASSITGVGKILQVVQTTKTDTFSVATTMNGSAGWTDITGMSVNITPSSASNKILIMTTGRTSATNHTVVRLLRGSTAIAIGDQEGSNRTRSSTGDLGVSGGYQNANASIIWLDSPSTTSQVTYKMQIASANTSYFNRQVSDSDHLVYTRSASVITAMEVAA